MRTTSMDHADCGELATPGAIASSGGPRPPRGLAIDVPDVLYDATLWRRWLFQLVTHQEVRLGYEAFCRGWEGHLSDVYRGRREFAEALESFLLACGLSWAQVDEIEAASRIQRHNLDQSARAFPGVARALASLAGLDVPLVAWADTPHAGARLAERLARLAPQARFDAAITSLDLERTQPDAECYQALAAALGASPGEVAYLGHEPEHLAGARAAGMVTVAVNFPADARADHLLGRFDELVPLVQSWSTTRPDARRALSGC